MTMLTSPRGPVPVETGAESTSHKSPRFVRWARRRPIAAFIALAYALSWSAWLVAFIGGGPPMVVLGAFGPAVGAGLVTHWSGGSLRDWLRPLARWRVPGRYYVYALGLPAALFGAINAELALLGRPVDLGRLGEAIPAYLGTFLFVALLGGGQEEPGWRGFALDRLQGRYSPIRATLLLGVVWGLWHLPLYGLGFVGPLMFVFFYTWLYNRSGSVLLCVLLHASFTPALDHLILTDDSPTVDAVIVATMLAGVLTLIGLTRGRLGFDHRASTLPPIEPPTDSPPTAPRTSSSGVVEEIRTESQYVPAAHSTRTRKVRRQ